MGQRDKLFEDTVSVLEWMSDENFKEFVRIVTEDHRGLTKRLRREMDRAEKKLLTKG